MTRVAGMSENVVPFIQQVSEKAPDKISKEWVLWMLKTINRANVEKVTLNPKWVMLSHNATGECSSPITHANYKSSADEPGWG